MQPRGTAGGGGRPRLRRAGSVDASGGETRNGVFIRNKTGSTNLWRPRSLVNLMSPMWKRGSAVFESSPDSPTSPPFPGSPMTKYTPDSPDNETAPVLNKTEKNERLESPIKKTSDGWGTLVSIVLVEAKGLPNPPTDGMPHGVYCKIRLGSQSVKSKTVQNILQPEWRERFQLYLLKDVILRLTLWDKGRQKTFMGSAVLHLSQLEKERTHEIWQLLDDGYGVVHLSITICNIHRRNQVNIEDIAEIRPENNAIFNQKANGKLVGQLYVKVVSAKGLSGKPNAYCSLEVDNERVRTHSARSNAAPTWNKNFVFNVYDVTSTLDVKVYDSSPMTSLHSESLGRVSIPLLRIRNGEMKWYALKDKTNRTSARGNCPRVLLEMSLFWNPVRAYFKVFQPREVKHIKKPPKFDIALVYKNLEFTRDTFMFLAKLNEGYKRLFEWENQELCCVALLFWLLFWYHFKLWTAPLLLLAPFVYFLICNRHHQRSFMRGYGIIESPSPESKRLFDKTKPEKGLTAIIQDLPDLTMTITSNVNYLAALSEKLYNLASFKVPFLSYITMMLLIVATAGLYLIPFNYIMMMFGIYKYSRNHLRSEKIYNNDIEDFISRIPDTELLNDWQELNVPEPAPVNGINVSARPYTLKSSVMY